MEVKRVYLIALAASAALLTNCSSVWALCSGPLASPEQLANFDKDPMAWLHGEPAVAPVKDNADLVARAPTTPLAKDIPALAEEAVNSQDPNFAANLQAMLAGASGDQGAFIGNALVGLNGSCTTLQDKRYIASIAMAIASSQNARANTAYGEATTPSQTAATGGGGGAGGGGSGGGGTAGPGTLPFFSVGPLSDGSTSTPNTSPNLLTGVSVGGSGSVSAF